MTVQATTRILIVAGEASGDAHAAALVRALHAAAPEKQIEFFGSTGAQMRETGVHSVVRADELAILGLWEIGQALPKFWRAFGELKQAATDRTPAAAILVDWPDFNLRLARWLHRRGIPVIYYISPQLWAWRSYRVRSVQRDVDLMLSILPFEQEWYGRHGMNRVEYVGHPLTGEVRALYDRDEFCRRHDLDPARPLIALLPGSRHKELLRILPSMLDAATLISSQRRDVQFAVMVAANRDPGEASEIIATANHHPPSDSLRVIHRETREALAAADVAAVASGTATLEAALLATPLVVVYKESAINWHTLGSLITSEHYGLVNLIAGRRLATELIQDDLNGPTLAQELLRLLDRNNNREMRDQLKEVSEKIGDPGASNRAALAILNFLGQAKTDQSSPTKK
jgi:lipid-A-disaccharide synthase